MNLTVDVTEGISPHWAALAGGGPLFATPGWLNAMAGRLGPETMTFVGWRDGRPTVAAFASVQRAHQPGELFDLHQVLVDPSPELPLTEPARAARASLVATAPPPPRWQPSLLVMLPGYECTPVGSTDPALLDALVEGMVAWARDRRIATVAALYVRPEAAALTSALARRGFVGVPLTPTWELHLPGSSPADYLAAMPAKRRKEVRRELRQLDHAGVRVEPVDAHAVLDDLVRLRCNLVAKYRAHRDPLAEGRKLRRIVDDVAGGRPHVLLATADRVPIGFALFAVHRREWHCLAVGTDYADWRSRLIYFATAYYHAADLAYQHGIRTIGYGLGAWPAKRARGCRPTPLTGWVHTTDPELAGTLADTARITQLQPL